MVLTMDYVINIGSRIQDMFKYANYDYVFKKIPVIMNEYKKWYSADNVEFISLSPECLTIKCINCKINK